MDKGKPGVMIYFEMGRAVRGLDYETKGRLFDAILDYAENGVLPSFDGVLSAVWPFVMSGIDRDSANYADKVLKRRRAAYAKWWEDYARDNHIDPGDRHAKERWIDMQMHARDANASGAMQTMPATATATAPATASTATAAPASAPAPASTAASTGARANALGAMQTMPAPAPTPASASASTGARATALGAMQTMPAPATATASTAASTGARANALGAMQRTRASGEGRRGGNIFMEILNEGGMKR